MEILKCENLTKIYGSNQTRVTALNNVNLSVQKGDFVSIVGASGSGKSTLLHLLGGVDRPTSGKIYVEDTEISSLKEEALAVFRRRKVGLIYQFYNLIPTLDVRKNILLPMLLDKRKVDEDRFSEIVSILGLSDRLNHLPSQLSGGQQQRVALARAIALEPDFLLLDEPLSALDAKVRLKLREQIRSLHRKLGITTIMVTHDQEEALCLADKMVVMNRGEIIQVGTPKEVYKNPETPFVADFIGTIDFMDDDINMVAIRPEDIRVEFNRDFKEIIDLKLRPYRYKN